MDNFLDSEIDRSSEAREVVQLAEGEIDSRIKLLSYSSLLTLHSCPRKYQLYRLKAIEDESDPVAACNQNITFAFGHIVGEGIQNILDGWSIEKVIWHAYLGWHASLDDVDMKRRKSFYFAVLALQKFIDLREQGFLKDYELLSFNGKSAKELSFRIHYPDGFKLRGSVDAVLRHRITGRILVLEVKTSSGTNLNPTTYKNSSQAIGYSVVLDVVCPEINSYDVLYLVYLTTQHAYEQLPFPKTYLQRAAWIQEVLLDIESIKLYENAGVYPMRGESCSAWGRDCEYLHQCTLSTSRIISPLYRDMAVDDKVYDIEITLEDLIRGQLSKVQDIQDTRETVMEMQLQDGDDIL